MKPIEKLFNQGFIDFVTRNTISNYDLACKCRLFKDNRKEINKNAL